MRNRKMLGAMDRCKIHEVDSIQNMEDTTKISSATGRILANLAGRAILLAVAFALSGADTVDAGLVNMFGGWSEIGDPGNAADGGGYGTVNYTYSIAKCAVSQNDYFSIMGGTNPNSDLPKVSISLYDAKKFANKLTENANGGWSDYNLYSADGTGAGTYTRSDALRDGKVVYAIPTEDEWYKAAYYDLEASDPGVDDIYWDYANGSDSAPSAGDSADTEWNYSGTLNRLRAVGSYGLEQNGTRNMMGNVWEWQEDTGGVRRGGDCYVGADYLRSSFRATNYAPTVEHGTVGFRVVAIPEPASGMLFVAVSGLLWFVRRKVRG
jgi:formylglycine-generating enzyme